MVGKRSSFSVFIFVLFGTLICSGQEKPAAFDEYKEDRAKLVYSEIAGYPGIEVIDPIILEALNIVPRHAFVPEHLRQYAYRNTALPIGYEQTISQPVIVASMSQMLGVVPGMKVLEVGTGSGYQAAVLAEAGAMVYSVEIIPELAERAKNTLRELNYNNVFVKFGDGYEGWEEYAPFEGIIVTCAPENVPEPLVNQLAPGGRIVIPLGPEGGIQILVILEKSEDGKLKQKKQYPVRFVPMTGKSQNKP